MNFPYSASHQCVDRTFQDRRFDGDGLRGSIADLEQQLFQQRCFQRSNGVLHRSRGSWLLFFGDHGGPGMIQCDNPVVDNSSFFCQILQWKSRLNRSRVREGARQMKRKIRQPCSNTKHGRTENYECIYTYVFISISFLFRRKLRTRVE